jgi:hypothetical protein
LFLKDNLKIKLSIDIKFLKFLLFIKWNYLKYYLYIIYPIIEYNYCLYEVYNSIRSIWIVY